MQPPRATLLRILTLLLVVVTGLQLCTGALVTTYEAAMAVEDWPTTRGQNMFLFPLAEWLHGPFDLLLEHGHRLWGTVVGMLTLAAAAAAFASPPRPSVRSLAIAAVVLVIVQGLVGGFRVLLDDQTVAKVHACCGPLFFAVVVALAVITCGGAATTPTAPAASRAAIALVAAAYLQLVAGAQLRHMDAGVDPRTFHGLVALHVSGAVVVAGLAFFAALANRTAVRGPRLWSAALAGLVCCQLALGGAAWIAKYGMPSAVLPDAWRLSEPIVARSGAGAAIVTGHAVLGMLILGGAVALALASGVLVRRGDAAVPDGRPGTEAFA